MFSLNVFILLKMKKHYQSQKCFGFENFSEFCTYEIILVFHVKNIDLCRFSVSIIVYSLITSISSLSGNLYLNAAYASLPGLFLGWTVIPMANW